MSDFIKSIVKTKLQNLTTQELLFYSRKYHFNISSSEAEQLTAYIRNMRADPFKANGRLKIHREISRITTKDTADKAQNLLVKIVKEHGFAHLLE
ncbi:DUF2624 family protein [Virgibacillus sp. W0181]|uniref:DUF2624 family protein n=1 Tax=Virgibacillus sp. W0181 TaxID=3391581 RepID=UPI003F448127